MTSYNLGFGNFTPTQLFVSTNSGAAWIISNLTSVIALDLTTFSPFSISLSNSAQPLSGGIMIDGTKVYVGASDGNVHALDVATHTDSAQVSPGLKDPSGNAVAPNLVLVLPK
jgi:outer membrane protein assembly factor BamB